MSAQIRQFIKLLEVKPVAPQPVAELAFVYGSLKRGFHNNELLDRARFIGTAHTAPRFDLIDLGSFPAAIQGKHSVSGEVYEVDARTMRDLDRLESNGSMYQRKKVPLALAGRQIVAWMYIYLEDDGYDPLVEPQGGMVTWNRPALNNTYER
jgi:gamma-glutamylaminecyclotransferase